MTAGARQAEGESRLDLVHKNVSIFKREYAKRQATKSHKMEFRNKFPTRLWLILNTGGGANLFRNAKHSGDEQN